MKIKNIKDVDGFFKVIDSCAGKVELITGEGDRLNLKSKLCQYVSLTSLLKSDVEIPELEVVAYEPEDTERIIKFLMTTRNEQKLIVKKRSAFFVPCFYFLLFTTCYDGCNSRHEIVQ